ncbi:MAG TPA: SCO family protein [Vicinamibacterales bacterium]|nr:SCO family protein [Vicinamibacterales bacterium]
MVVVATLALVLLFQGCAPSPGAPRQYDLDGQILAIRPEQNEVLIKHGDIEGFMPGMTMPFKVRDAALLGDKMPGDLVQATLMVAETDAWIASLVKVGEAPLAETVPMPAAAFVTPLTPGDLAPETALVDQSGAPLSLADWNGSAAAVTFIYIRCPLPDFCPLLDRRFTEVQRLITDDATLRERARLLSVSFDPDADTPPRLQAHADRLGADPAIWRFATAPREVVDRFAATFGVNVIREQDSTITHNMRTAVVGPDRRVVSIHDGSDWTPAQIADDMRRALAR